MAELLMYEEGVTVGTEPPPRPSIVWVLVEGVRKPRTQWTYRTYRLTEDKPDMLCRSYAELCVWLYTYGVTPPPPDYFTPTPEEQAEGVEWIVRGVMRLR